MRPIIGILSTYNEKTQKGYIKAIEKSGGCPIIISKVDKIDTIKNIIKLLDGIVFTGGVDINPLNYGEEPKNGLGRIDSERDAFELDLIKSILSDTNIPILGICRGMQILNVALGGSLFQDLINQKVTDVNHSLEDVYLWSEPSHYVNVVKSSKIYKVFKEDKILVNSLHHQGINILGHNLEVVMVSEDNIVEAIELKGDRFVVGLQWHPEMLVEKHTEYLDIFKLFIDYCILGYF